MKGSDAPPPSVFFGWGRLGGGQFFFFGVVKGSQPLLSAGLAFQWLSTVEITLQTSGIVNRVE